MCGHKMYNLPTFLQDSGDPPLYGWTSLHIYLTDGDDLNPTFDNTDYYIEFDEEVSPTSWSA